MQNLRNTLSRIDGRGYKVYKSIEGSYQGQNYTLHIDYAQPDPFAPPSRVRLALPQSVTGHLASWCSPRHRRVAFADFLAREVAASIKHLAWKPQGTGNSQTQAIAYILGHIYNKEASATLPLNDVIDRVLELIQTHGLDIISPYVGQHPGDLALPRKHEIAAALNRLRQLVVE